MGLGNSSSNNSYSSNNSFPALNKKRKNRKKGKKLLKVLIFLVLLSISIFLFKDKVKNFIYSYSNKQTSKQKVKGEQMVKSQTITLDKKFEFPGFNEAGKKKGTIELKIIEVEKTNQVIVQDKNYTAKNNKIFLIINLELKNETTKRLNIFPGDLIRLIVDDQEKKKFAPDLHNNYVLISPISTKIDRIGFVIDQNFKNLKLQVGELDEEKEILEIKFPT